jgi:hypothetical protein
MGVAMTENNQQPDDALVIVEEVQPEALAQIHKADVDIQIATAKEYPRSLQRFVDRCTEMACFSQEVAASCMYTLPRDGKHITGPSIRFAEIVASTYGNLRVATRIIKEESKWIVAEAISHDLETNLAVCIQARRRITRKDGSRYNEDMIGVTGMAAQAVAYRNAVTKVVPRGLWEPIYNQTMKVSAGDEKTFIERRKEMLDYFAKDLKVLPKRVYASLGIEGVNDLGAKEFAILRGYVNSIKAGEVAINTVFPDPAKVEKGPKTLDDVAEKLEGK